MLAIAREKLLLASNVLSVYLSSSRLYLEGCSIQLCNEISWKLLEEYSSTFKEVLRMVNRRVTGNISVRPVHGQGHT